MCILPARTDLESLVLHPLPLAFHNVVMEVQNGFINQVQVVRRLLLHERLKVRYVVCGCLCVAAVSVCGLFL
jgi:hypothetical protein